MYLATRIRLLPTPNQEIVFRKSAGIARWAYNYLLGENKKHYEITKKSIKETEVRKQITLLKKTTEYEWLNEVGSNVIKQGVKDADMALKRFLKGTSGYPRFKSRHKSTLSFYVNYENLKKTQKGFRGEKLGEVRTTKPLPKLKHGAKYSNPRITFDGKHWYLSVGYEVEPKKTQLTNVSLGIDVGVKHLAICSNSKVYKNINKTKRVRQLEKRLKRQQRRLSKRLEGNTLSKTNNNPTYKKPLRKCKNIQKQISQVRITYKKLKNIRTNHLHQTTCDIVKTKPCRIVIETLNIHGMMKNAHMAKAIAEQCLYEFQRQIIYKAELYGIEVVKADKWFPSSKKCSSCGHIKSDLKLKDRVYKCNRCGLIIDRDYNASLNLANY